MLTSAQAWDALAKAAPRDEWLSIAQVYELVVCDCGLIFLQLAPIRLAAEGAQIGRGVVRRFLVERSGGRNAEQKEEREPARNERTKHQLGIFEFNTMIAGCSRFFSSATSLANRVATR